MDRDLNERFRQLCEKISMEYDKAKFEELLVELNQLLAQEEAARKARESNRKE